MGLAVVDDGEGVGGTHGSAHRDLDGVVGLHGVILGVLPGDGEGVGGMQGSAHSGQLGGGEGDGDMQGSAHREVFVGELVPVVVGGGVVGVGVVVVEVFEVVVVVVGLFVLASALSLTSCIATQKMSLSPGFFVFSGGGEGVGGGRFLAGANSLSGS